MGLEAGGRVFFAQAVADEDGREIHDHHQQDEEQRGGENHGLGGVRVRRLEAHVVDMKAQMHEFAFQVDEGAFPVDGQGGGQLDHPRDHERGYLSGAPGHGQNEAGHDARQGAGEDDAFNRLNHFPSDMSFQTFLLDKDNKVVVIGNPIHNLKLGELYMQIIQGEEKKQKNVDRRSITTEVSIARSTVFLGNFDWQTKQKAIFTLKNTGGNPLVIENVSTSCGCTSAFYSQKPILSGKETKIEVIYEAEQPEYFNKKITVYCNAESSPIILSISGDAK